MKKILLLSLFVIAMQTFTQAQNEVTSFADVKKRAFKLEFFSPMYGTLNLGYEQTITSRVNLDLGVGIIGVGFNEAAEAATGAFARGGMRLYFSPDYYTDDLKYFSDFQGSYFRPEMILSFFNYEITDDFGVPQEGYNASMGIQLNLGKQWAIANTVALDLWGGLGYNFNFTDESKDMPWKYGYVGGSGGFPISASFGFSIGVLTK